MEMNQHSNYNLESEMFSEILLFRSLVLVFFPASVTTTKKIEIKWTSNQEPFTNLITKTLLLLSTKLLRTMQVTN